MTDFRFLAAVFVAALLTISDAHAQDNDLPLQVDRTTRIDLTEGTWISLDVSPDGESIVFDYLGDLFMVPFEGGTATRITSGLAFDAQPRYSPDGESIVFTSDRDGGQNIWMMDVADSTFTQLSKGDANRAESPEFLPDGKYVVASMGGFRGGGLPTLKIFHVDGGGGIDLVEDAGSLKMLGPAPSPDGRWIWYARRSGDWQYNAQFPQYQIEAFDRETGERYTKTSRYGSALRPTLSPDGRWLVYGTRHDEETGLVLRDLETSEETWLAYPVQNDDQESRATLDVLPGMSFTPDSKWLVTSYGGGFWKIPVDGGAAVAIPFRVTFDLELGPKVLFDYPIEDTPTFTVRQIRDAVPSPDGSMLAFTALDRLWVSDADGSNPRRLTDADESEHYPTWSPDGEWIAYATWDGREGHLMKVRSNGRGDAVRLSAASALYFDPSWAPSDRIVALKGFVESYETQGAEGESSREIIWLPADPETGDGSAARVVGPTDGRSGPHFVEGSDRIYMRRSPDALVSLRWDGTDEKTHIKVRGPSPEGSSSRLSPSTLKMAPRGDLALAEIQRHIYAVTVPEFGTAPTINVGGSSSSVPSRQLTDVGGEFPAWGSDGRTVHFSLGNAHFVYDLDRAEAVDDSLEAVKKMEEDVEDEEGEDAQEDDDDAADDDEEEDAEDDEDENAYKPHEFRVVIEADRDLPDGTVVLNGARVITMNGREVIEDADLVIQGNRIEAVGQAGSVDIPEDATRLDMSGRTIVPGYVDTHAHLRARDGIHRTDVWPFLANLAWGVTTTRDPQTGNTEVLSYADMVRSGQVIGPRIYSTGPGVFWQDRIDTEEEAHDVLKRYSEYFDTKTIKMYVAAARKGRQYIIMAAKDLELMPTTEGSLNIKQNLTESLDGYPGLEHSLPIFPVYDDYVQLFVETERYYTPTLLVTYGGPWAENWFYSRESPHDNEKVRRFVPHDWVDARTLRRGQWFSDKAHVFDRHAEFVKELVEAGGKAGVGSHGQFQGIGYHWELWAMASADMDPHDALMVATLHGAEAIGLDQDLGSIEPGKLADLVILDANPLENIRNTNAIDAVMMNGRLFDGDTLNETYPREQTLPALWWWDDEPENVPGME